LFAGGHPCFQKGIRDCQHHRTNEESDDADSDQAADDTGKDTQSITITAVSTAVAGVRRKPRRQILCGGGGTVKDARDLTQATISCALSPMVKTASEIGTTSTRSSTTVMTATASLHLPQSRFRRPSRSGQVATTIVVAQTKGVRKGWTNQKLARIKPADEQYRQSRTSESIISANSFRWDTLSPNNPELLT